MKFDELDKKMRVYETTNDYCVLPNIYMVARIDGRSFTKLTKEKHKFEAPFDIKFRDLMVATTEHLMNCGFNIIYGYTESDEISLLFSINESVFKRKTRKYNSILAGEASAKFSLLLKDIGVFDSRISQLPTKKLVIDYFRWRNEDAYRNSLNANCYWMLRKKGITAKKASEKIEGISIASKNELLFQNEINFNKLPNWQKRGVGLYWGTYDKEGFNEKTKKITTTKRRKLKIDYDLPMKDKYSRFIEMLLEKESSNKK